jgi:hypothetical protein
LLQNGLRPGWKGNPILESKVGGSWASEEKRVSIVAVIVIVVAAAVLAMLVAGGRRAARLRAGDDLAPVDDDLQPYRSHAEASRRGDGGSL